MLEFALIAPALIALLLAVLETSLIYFANAALETAAEASARVLLTGQAQKNGYNAGQLKQVACNNLPAFLSCSALMMDVQKASDFASVNTSAPTITYDAQGNVTNNFSYTPGASGDIVIIRLLYIWPLPSGPLGLDFSNAGAGKRLLVATTVAKIEPY